MAKRVRAVFYECGPAEAHAFAPQLADLTVEFLAEPLNARTAHAARSAEIVSVFIGSRVDDEVLALLPRLRLVVTRSTGYDHIDLAACARRGVAVTNVPHYGENTVAEHTFGLILALSRNIHRAYQRTVRGDFSIEGLQGFDLRGRTLGVIGVGNIGLHVIRIAKGFGMHVLAYDVRQHLVVAEVLDFHYAPLDEVLERSDVLTLHVPYTPATHHLINRERLARVKRGALLINTARGAVVDTAALLWALDEGILAGAGLDVIEGEALIREERELLYAPAAEEKLRILLQQHALLRRDNVVVTPHIAFNSREAVQRIVDTTIANVRAFLAGTPQNLVSSSP